MTRGQRSPKSTVTDVAVLYEPPCLCGHGYHEHHVFTNRSRSRAFNCILRHVKIRHGCSLCTCRAFDRDYNRMRNWIAHQTDTL